MEAPVALISRTPTVEIYDPTGDRLIATPDDWLWGAAAGPAFTYDAAGPSTITLRALRVPGGRTGRGIGTVAAASPKATGC